MPIGREQLEADVLIIGAGPSGLACALHLANLIEQHNKAGRSPELSTENVYVLEKAREPGHINCRAPFWTRARCGNWCPISRKLRRSTHRFTSDAVHFLTEKNSWKLPITPPPFSEPRELRDFVEQTHGVVIATRGTKGSESVYGLFGPGADL